MTYRFALFSIQRGGLAAGVNIGDDDSVVLDSFIDEVDDHVSSSQWRMFALSGIAGDAGDRWSAGIDRRAEAAGIVAAAASALGRDLDGARVVIDRLDAASLELIDALDTAGAQVVAVGTLRGTAQGENLSAPALRAAAETGELSELGTLADSSALGIDADVAFVGAKMGAIDHTNAETVAAGLVVPIGLLPFTTKAAVMLQRRSVTVLPDFLSLGGGSLVTDGDAGDAEAAAAQVAETTNAVLADRDQLPSVNAALRAESFLASWREPVFGRPFAP